VEYLEADNADPERFVWSACAKAIPARFKRASQVLESLHELTHQASPAGLIDFAAVCCPRRWRRAGFDALQRGQVLAPTSRERQSKVKRVAWKGGDSIGLDQAEVPLSASTAHD